MNRANVIAGREVREGRPNSAQGAGRGGSIWIGIDPRHIIAVARASVARVSNGLYA
ncbi:MAG TPA: hypothetical protein VFJ58_29400 [Armatimonadota bacterium]|nr:hypothetical protein [Armatimonadota bacterium]